MIPDILEEPITALSSALTGITRSRGETVAGNKVSFSLRRKPALVLILPFVSILFTACGLGGPVAQTVATVAPSQTPWIIYVPITNTPEPPTVTPLPTITTAATARPTRTSTRPAPPRPSPTRTVVQPTAVAVLPSPTVAPSCAYGSVVPKFPENGTERRTKTTGVGSDTFDFKFDVPAALQGLTDPQVGYQIIVLSKRAGFSNGITVYFSNVRFFREGQHFILDARALASLAGGEDVTVTWTVTIIRTTGSFDDTDPTKPPPGIVNCGPPSPPWMIKLLVV